MHWDAKTVTAGDYTIEFNLPEEFFAKWERVWGEYWITHSDKKYMSMVEAFRDWLTLEMEKRLDCMPDLGYNRGGRLEHVKVAMTTFAFENEDVIKLLEKRGALIQNEDWDKMGDIDKEINELMERD